MNIKLFTNFIKANTLLILSPLVQCMCGNSYSVMASKTPAATVEPTGKHTATVIFLHGLGDTGHGWCDMFKSFQGPYIKFLCPHSPSRPVTLNGGLTMPAWFDIFSLSAGVNEDEAGIIEASNKLQNIIEEEVKSGIDRSRILIGGFSQGGALAMYTALTNPQPIAGLLTLSCWLPLATKFPKELKGEKSFPIFQCHGDQDPMVNPAFGRMTADLLSKMCSNHTFTTYPGLGHHSSDKELLDVKNFIEKTLPQV